MQIPHPSKSAADDSCNLSRNSLISFQRLHLFGSTKNGQSSSDTLGTLGNTHQGPLLLTNKHGAQCRQKNFHGSSDIQFVWWTLHILYKFVKSPIRHLGLAIVNVRCVLTVLRFSPTLGSISIQAWLSIKCEMKLLIHNPFCWSLRMDNLSG